MPSIRELLSAKKKAGSVPETAGVAEEKAGTAAPKEVAVETVKVVVPVKKRGRPTLGEVRMTRAEYQKRWRARKKAK